MFNTPAPFTNELVASQTTITMCPVAMRSSTTVKDHQQRQSTCSAITSQCLQVSHTHYLEVAVMANRKMALAQDVHLTIWPKTIGAAMNGLPAPKKNHIACSSCSTCESGSWAEETTGATGFEHRGSSPQMNHSVSTVSVLHSCEHSNCEVHRVLRDSAIHDIAGHLCPRLLREISTADQLLS